MGGDFSTLAEMTYSGMGITVGLTPSGHPFIGYSLTGRSPPSQARELLLGENTGIIRTSLVEDDERLKRMFDIRNDWDFAELKRKLEEGSRALIEYPAIVPIGSEALVASNGVQTELVCSVASNQFSLRPDQMLERAMRSSSWRYDPQHDRMINITTFEPDPPNNTPRINAIVKGGDAAMQIVLCEGGEKKSYVFPIRLERGIGGLLTTYSGGNESPLDPFEGEPFEVAIGSESAREIAESIYEAIHGGQSKGDNYRVAAAVAMLNSGRLETAIINRVERGN
ncbi:MAG: IMP cyclohydrolase [archaeon]